MHNEAEVVVGAFNHCEPLEQDTRAEKEPINSTLPPTPSSTPPSSQHQHKHQHQQITKPMEVEQMAKPDRYHEQHEMQNQRDLHQELNNEIQKCFSSQKTIELQENLELKPLAPDKIGLKFRVKIDLCEDDKAKLRECIKAVYGHTISIVMIPKLRVVQAPNKLQMPIAEGSEQQKRGANDIATSTPANFKWNQIKNEVVSSVYANIAEQIRASLDQVLIASLVDRKLQLKASWLVCQTLENYQAIIEKIAAKHDVDIELENITDKEIMYFPWVYPSKDLPPLTLDNLNK